MLGRGAPKTRQRGPDASKGDISWGRRTRRGAAARADAGSGRGGGLAEANAGELLDRTSAPPSRWTGWGTPRSRGRTREQPALDPGRPPPRRRPSFVALSDFSAGLTLDNQTPLVVSNRAGDSLVAWVHTTATMGAPQEIRVASVNPDGSLAKPVEAIDTGGGSDSEPDRGDQRERRRRDRLGEGHHRSGEHTPGAWRTLRRQDRLWTQPPSEPHRQRSTAPATQSSSGPTTMA